MSESLSGTIERVTFHNPENGFVVLRVHVKGTRPLVTVVGQVARAVAGEYVEATSITQEVMSNRADVSNYFQEWFGPTGYMRKMEMKLDADTLTELSPDKSWGLVRGKALEHYEAKDGDLFDFVTRWTAVMVRSDDGNWRLRAIHFGTNHLDNPVLTKVRRTLVHYGIIGAIASLIVGLGLGWWIGRRRGGTARAAQV